MDNQLAQNRKADADRKAAWVKSYRTQQAAKVSCQCDECRAFARKWGF